MQRPFLGYPVIFRRHVDHGHLGDQAEFAAQVGRINDDGTVDLHVLVPERPAVWFPSVAHGFTPYTFHYPDEQEPVAAATIAADPTPAPVETATAKTTVQAPAPTPAPTPATATPAADDPADEPAATATAAPAAS